MIRELPQLPRVVKHILLHHLIIPLLDLIQSPYHGIIITLVVKCPLHVHQQVLHRDVFTFVQHAGPFTQVPMETGEDVGVHTGPIILLKKGIYIKMPERVHHLHPRISRLEDRHIQSHWHQPFPFPTPLWPLHLCQQLAVSLTVEYLSESGTPLSGEEGGKPPPLTVVHWVLGGFLQGRAVPAWVTGLASVLSPTPEVLPSC